MGRENKRKRAIFLPPIFIAGVLVILVPIFTFLTMERLERQNEFIIQKMVERGMALIRTFEAGTRTGMFTMQWGASRIQTMLQETALQPDVAYIAIITRQGDILAHSDPDKVGQTFDNMPKFEGLPLDPFKGVHRIVENTNGKPIFELYKRFVPLKRGPKRKNMRNLMHGLMQKNEGYKPFKRPEIRPEKRFEHKDWSLFYRQSWNENRLLEPEHYIIAGLAMEKAKALRNTMVKQTVFRTIILFFLGLAGLLALFAFQAYRNTKASLTSVRAFSDTVIQNMPSGMVMVDQTLKVSAMNRAARQIIGNELKRPFSEWIAMIRDLGEANPVINREMSLKVKDRKRIRLDVTASFIEENREGGFLFLIKDLTQVQELQQQVETNKRLAATGKLAAGVAHEIRNPLSSIKGFATYFAKRHSGNAEDAQTAKIMIGEVDRMNRSITQLLEFSKPMAVEKREVNLHSLIEHSIKLVQHDLEQKNISTKVDIRSQTDKIYTDPDRMNQVFLNLYINAIDSLPENGTLTVRVDDIDPSGGLEFQIQDNGTGIEDYNIEKIFDPYFTTRSTGTGLGLSIVHRIVENLNGSIRVKSEKGAGTNFIIQLPGQ